MVARRIIPGSADQAINAGIRDAVEAGVPTRNHQDDGWCGDLAMFEPQRLDVTSEMVDGNERLARSPRGGLRKSHTHE